MTLLLHTGLAAGLVERPKERLARRLRGEVVGRGQPAVRAAAQGYSPPLKTAPTRKPSATDIFVLVAAPRPDPRSIPHRKDEYVPIPWAPAPAPVSAHSPAVAATATPLRPVAAPAPPPVAAHAPAGGGPKVPVEVHGGKAAEVHHALLHHEISTAHARKGKQHAGANSTANSSRAAASVEESKPPSKPPKIPVISDTECKLLQEAVVLEPKFECHHAVFSSNWDGCDCTFYLNGNDWPQPDLLFNPFQEAIAPSPDVPGIPMMPTLPPVMSVWNTHYLPPPKLNPPCPLSNHCGKDGGFECVGYDSFGFSEVTKGKFSPASRYFNSINCFYIMKPYDQWNLPKKVEAFWYLQAKRAHVQDFYMGNDISIQCGPETKTDKHFVFCEDFVFYLQFACETPWRMLFKGSCLGAPAPEHFSDTATLGEVCPFECGFHTGEPTWPYPKSAISTAPQYAWQAGYMPPQR